MPNGLRIVFPVLLLGLSSVANAGGTVVLANGEWVPYMGKQLPGGGPVSRLVRAAFKTEGWTVEYRYLPWKRGFEMAKSGTLDGTIIWSKTSDRQKDFDFSAPVISLTTVVFYNKRHPLHWKTRDDLKGKKLGGVAGYSYAFVNRENGYTVDRVSDAAINYRKLAVGRLDGVMEEVQVGLNLAKKEGVANQIGYDPKPIKSNPYFLIVGKADKRATAILKVFNQGLARLRDSGRYGSILKRNP